MSYKNKQIIEFETFDYYSINPFDINELYNKDKELFQPLLKNKTLYALCSGHFRDEAIENKGMWYYYKLPNDDATEFKYEIHFSNIISEHTIPMDVYSYDGCTLHFGLCKISLDEYFKNYDFYNNPNGPYLIIADECDIEKIDDIIKKIIYVLVQNILEQRKCIFVDDFFNGFETSELNNFCTIIWLDDDSEFKLIKILHKDID